MVCLPNKHTAGVGPIKRFNPVGTNPWLTKEIFKMTPETIGTVVPFNMLLIMGSPTRDPHKRTDPAPQQGEHRTERVPHDLGVSVDDVKNLHDLPPTPNTG
jgi:hypothetical protein